MQEEIGNILRSASKPKEKQKKLVESIISGSIAIKEWIDFFVSASDKDKGTCADVMKHISAEKPALLASYLPVLIPYIGHPVPRVKWGIPETIGNLSKDYPEEIIAAIPFLLENTIDNSDNTTVIRWCAAYGLTEIAKNNPSTRNQLMRAFDKILQHEQNNGVRNVYLKAIKIITRTNQ